MLRVLEALEPQPHPETVFEVHDVAEPATIGPFRLDSWPLPHHVPSYGVRLTTPDSTIAYSSDTGPSPALAELARDADLFICDATYQGRPSEEEPHYLLTAGEAGEWAARANAKSLLLSHFWPGSDRAVSVAEARVRYSGEVLAAEEGLRLPL